MSLLGLAEGVSEPFSPAGGHELAAGTAEQCCHLESLICDFIPGAGFPTFPTLNSDCRIDSSPPEQTRVKPFEMSPFGTKQTSRCAQPMSAFGGIADIRRRRLCPLLTQSGHGRPSGQANAACFCQRRNATSAQMPSTMPNGHAP